jgi:hypothetical protein
MAGILILGFSNSSTFILSDLNPLWQVWRLVRSSFRILLNKGMYNVDWQMLKMGVSDD